MGEEVVDQEEEVEVAVVTMEIEVTVKRIYWAGELITIPDTITSLVAYTLHHERDLSSIYSPRGDTRQSG